MSDLDLPPLWQDPVPRMDYHLAELRAYEAANGVQFGGPTLIKFLAVGAAETGLNSFKVGPNALNGTPPDNEAHRGIGLGTYQEDSWWIYRNVQEGHWPRKDAWNHQFLGNVEHEVRYLLTVPGYVTRTSPEAIEIDWDLWTTYRTGKHFEWVDDATLALQREDNPKAGQV